VTPSQDELWTPDDQETDGHIRARALSVLQDIWHKYPADTCKCELCRLTRNTHLSSDVSVTSHGGFTSALLRVVGRGTYGLPTGGMYIPRQMLFRASSRLGVIPIVIRRTVS